MVVTTDHIYLSMNYGERVKMNRTNTSLLWAVKYGSSGYSMAISPDQTYLLAGSKFGNKAHLGKLSSIDGSVNSSKTSNISADYTYILVSDSRALCFNG